MAQPFARAKMMMAAIAAMASGGNILGAMASLGPYVSRGHGGKHRVMARQNYTSHNRYTPHQGGRECARRVRQGLVGQGTVALVDATPVVS